MSAHLVKPNAKLGIIVAIVTAAIFGLYPPASRAAYADGANAILVILASIFLRGFFMAAYCRYKGLELFASSVGWRQTILSGFAQALSVIGIIGALVYLPGPLVLIILFTFPFILLMFLLWRGEEKLNSGVVVLTLGALAGLSLVLDVWAKDATIVWPGVGLSFMAAIATVFRMYIYGKQMESKSPFVVGAENFVVAFVFVLFLLFWKTPELPNTLAGYAWVSLSMASLVIASFGMFVGIALIGPFSWSLFSKTEPVFVAIYSALLLGEYLKVSQYLGMGIVLTSLVAYQFVSKKKVAGAE